MGTPIGWSARLAACTGTHAILRPRRTPDSPGNPRCDPLEGRDHVPLTRSGSVKAIEKRLLEVLEPAGLAALIRGALGRGEMVRIANANRVSVPGMRNRSVSLGRL